MASTQRTDRGWLSKAAKQHELYVTFCQDQVTANQMLRATQAAYHLAEQAVRDQPSSELLATLFRNQIVPPDVFRRYGSSEGATVGALRGDLKSVDRRLQDAVIIYYVGAFERFLNNFVVAASKIITTRGQRRPTLEKLLQKAQSDRWAIDLENASKNLPEIRARLRDSYPTHKPLEHVPPTWDCFIVTQMWREVRNLILHHDRRVHETFNRETGAHWAGYRSTFRKRATVPEVGSSLPLDYRDVIHCFTHVRRSVDELIAILCDEYDAIPIA